MSFLRPWLGLGVRCQLWLSYGLGSAWIVQCPQWMEVNAVSLKGCLCKLAWVCVCCPGDLTLFTQSHNQDLSSVWGQKATLHNVCLFLCVNDRERGAPLDPLCLRFDRVRLVKMLLSCSSNHLFKSRLGHSWTYVALLWNFELAGVLFMKSYSGMWWSVYVEEKCHCSPFFCSVVSSSPVCLCVQVGFRLTLPCVWIQFILLQTSGVSVK